MTWYIIKRDIHPRVALPPSRAMWTASGVITRVAEMFKWMICIYVNRWSDWRMTRSGSLHTKHKSGCPRSCDHTQVFVVRSFPYFCPHWALFCATVSVSMHSLQCAFDAQGGWVQIRIYLRLRVCDDLQGSHWVVSLITTETWCVLGISHAVV